jgi:hypothetical protein
MKQLQVRSTGTSVKQASNLNTDMAGKPKRKFPKSYALAMERQDTSSLSVINGTKIGMVL